MITGVGGWFKSGKGLVSIRWVHVRDLDGTHRDKYFFTTDTSMSASAVLEMHGGRWKIETTFQELRAHLGLEMNRGWHRQTVLRMAPCLFTLHMIVEIFYDTMPERSSHLRTGSWLGKESITFSDMIIIVRHHLWLEWTLEHTPVGKSVRKLPKQVRGLLDFGLTQGRLKRKSRTKTPAIELDTVAV